MAASTSEDSDPSILMRGARPVPSTGRPRGPPVEAAFAQRAVSDRGSQVPGKNHVQKELTMEEIV